MSDVPSAKDSAADTERRDKPLRACVQVALELLFKDLDGHHPTELYDLVLSEVEYPLLETVLRYAQGNQAAAARMLGITRTTLRKKLKLYGLD